MVCMTDTVYSLKTVSYLDMVYMTDTVYSLKTVSYLYMVCMTDTVYTALRQYLTKPYKGKILS
jgi:hypothetical protein